MIPPGLETMTGEKCALTEENLRDLNSYIDSKYGAPQWMKDMQQNKEKKAKKPTPSKAPPEHNPTEQLDTEQQLLKPDVDIPAPSEPQNNEAKLKLDLLPPTKKAATAESVGGLFFATKFLKKAKND